MEIKKNNMIQLNKLKAANDKFDEFSFMHKRLMNIIEEKKILDEKIIDNDREHKIYLIDKLQKSFKNEEKVYSIDMIRKKRFVKLYNTNIDDRNKYELLVS